MPQASDVTVITADHQTNIVLFAAGRGGHPARHLPFLTALAERGSTIIAPHFDMLKTTVPEKAELDERIETLEDVIASHAGDTPQLVGIGHSIGAVVLLAAAGAKGRTRAGDLFGAQQPVQFARLALFAPPTGFFRPPGALEDVDTPMDIWVGAKDTITPPEQALFLKSALDGKPPVNVHIDPDAGHFTFMNELPPGVIDPHLDRSAYLTTLAEQITQLITP